MASGETIPVLKEALVELTLVQRALRIWVFVAEVTAEFILGLDVLRDYDASVDLGRHLLRRVRRKLHYGDLAPNQNLAGSPSSATK